MKIEKFLISRDPQWYHAWPDVALTSDGTLVCIFNECTNHCSRPHSCIMLCESADRGRTWTEKHPLTEATDNLNYYYNCPRISALPDGRLAAVVDRIPSEGEGSGAGKSEILLYFSSDCGKNWESPVTIPLHGIVPSKLTVLDNGRWLLAAHYPFGNKLTEFLVYSDNSGKNWSREITLAHDERYQLCEVSLLPLGGGTVVGLLREDSGLGLDCFKTISYDNGETWGPLIPLPMPGCHRPVAGLLNDNRIFITYRFHQGGGGGMGSAAQNFFGALTNRESVLSDSRKGARIRIVPIDYDSAAKADTGYSGWVQFPDGEIYVVNYIMDDQENRAQIRGYSLFTANKRKGDCCPGCSTPEVGERLCGILPE